jgi:hypothetical protein
MKIKTSELTGLALDWAVAKCEELEVYIPAYAETPWLQIRTAVGPPVLCPRYSTDWSQGGPIIERERIAILCTKSGGFWDARDGKVFNVLVVYHRGTTPLIAAMRCYVASKLGKEIDIPEDLLNG